MDTPPRSAAPSLFPAPFSTTRNVLALMCVMYGLTYIDRISVSTASTVFQGDLHLTNTQVGLIFSAFGYPYLLFQVIGGWVSDRYGARLALTVSAVIWGAATLLMGAAGSLSAMLGARVLLGFGEGATFPTATRALSVWYPGEKRAFVQGVTHSSARLGAALTPPLAAWLIASTTWRGSFFVLGIVSLAWAAAWGYYFRDDPASHPGITEQELRRLPVRVPGASRSHRRAPWLSLMRRMAPVTAVYFCYGWTLWLYLTWIPSFFQHSYGLNLKSSALFSGGVFFAGVVGNAVGGVASDWVFRRTGDLNRARRDLVVAGLLLSLACMAPVPFSHRLALVAVCLSLAFFFAEFTIGPMWAVPMDVAPRFSGSASGLMNVGSALATIVSPLVSGYVIDRTRNWELPFVISAVLLLLGAVMAFWMKPNEKLAGADWDDVKEASADWDGPPMSASGGME